MKTTRSSGPRSTEYSYLFSFFPHSPPSSHFFSWFSSQSNGSRSTEFSHLFSFFPHTTLRSRHNVAFVVWLTPTVQEIISHPIRSRHVDPVEFVVRLTPTVHGAISHPIRSRHVDRSCSSRDNFSSNQITTLISTSNQIATCPTEFSLIFSDFLEEFVCPGTTSREVLVQSDHETYIPAQSDNDIY